MVKNSIEQPGLTLLANDMSYLLNLFHAPSIAFIYHLIIGSHVANLMLGTPGNDVFFGGTDNDTMIGGAGNDIYFANTTNDVVHEQAGKGTDTLYSSVNYTLGVNVENLTLFGNHAFTGTGNELDNVITGNDLANTLNGSIGNDTIFGMGGNDTIDGGIGNDEMHGGLGNDTYFVDSMNDIVQENIGEGTDIVYSSASFTLSADVENLTLLGTDNLNGTGNDSNNSIFGNTGNNKLYAGSGNDLLYGDEGNDSLYGAAGTDLLFGGKGDDVYYINGDNNFALEAPNEGISDKVYSSVAYYGLTDNIELLELTGNAIGGAGNNLSNRIQANDKDNILNGLGGDDGIYGGAGKDIIYGGDGEDVLKGGDGDDVLIGNSGHDSFYGGTGLDIFSYSANTDSAIGLHLRDVIYDFSQAERDILDFSSFAGNFNFIGTDAFTGTAHEIHYTHDNSGNTIITIDSDGNGTANFEIQLVGSYTLGIGDFAV